MQSAVPAVGVPPQNVSMAIAVEVGRARDLPGAVDDSETLTCEFRAAVRIPKDCVAVGIPPENVREEIAVEIIDDARRRSKTINRNGFVRKR